MGGNPLRVDCRCNHRTRLYRGNPQSIRLRGDLHRCGRAGGSDVAGKPLLSGAIRFQRGYEDVIIETVTAASGNDTEDIGGSILRTANAKRCGVLPYPHSRAKKALFVNAISKDFLLNVKYSGRFTIIVPKF